MNKKLKNFLKFLLFLSIGLGVFWWVYKDVDTQKIGEALNKANYFWIGLSLVFAFFSHFSRAMRWNIMIEPLGYKPKNLNSFFAIMIMYLSNMAVPRSGEFARCAVMAKYEKVPFPKLLGTAVTGRVFDFIMLFILTAVMFLTQFPQVVQIWKNNPGAAEKVSSMLDSVPLLIGVGLAILVLGGLLFYFRDKIKQLSFYKKIKETVSNFIAGVLSIKDMERKWEFILHTVFIWVMYFLMIYVTFFSFEFTSNLGILTGLTIFVMSSFGMVFPSPGGIGSWHFMVIQTLFIYGVTSEVDAAAFAFAVHGSMTVFIILLGVISVILIPVVNRDMPVEKLD